MRRRAVLGVALGVLLFGRVLAVSAATSFPDDPFFAAGDQWGLTGATASIQAPAAWCVSTGAGITVADVDTGADFSHVDLAGKLIAGAQFLGGSAPYPYENGGQPTGTGESAVPDDVGHGTMTAGIIAANTNNGQGIAAVAPSARILVVKVLRSDGNGGGTGSDSDVANGIRWAADNGAQVINVSIGPGLGVGFSVTSNIPDAVSYAASKGSSVALAAGNSNLPLGAWQGVGNSALVVGALTPSATVASYSNSGAGVSIYAPGGDASSSSDQVHHNIVSTNNDGGYAAEAGTSFAAPHVAGTLALLRATGVSDASARSRIVQTAVSRNGHPDLHAAAALGASGTCGAASGPAPTPPPVSTTPPGHNPPPPTRTQPPAPRTAAPAGSPATRAATTSPAASSTPIAAPSGAAIAAASSDTPAAAAISATVVPDAPASDSGSGVGRRALVVAAVVAGSGLAAGGITGAAALLRRRRPG